MRIAILVMLGVCAAACGGAGGVPAPAQSDEVGAEAPSPAPSVVSEADVLWREVKDATAPCDEAMNAMAVLLQRPDAPSNLSAIARAGEEVADRCEEVAGALDAMDLPAREPELRACRQSYFMRQRVGEEVAELGSAPNERVIASAGRMLDAANALRERCLIALAEE